MASSASSSSLSSPSSSQDHSATQDWLESILEGYYDTKSTAEDRPEIEVIQWDIKPVEGEIYLSELLSLDVTFAEDGEEKRIRMVAKLLPEDSRNRAFVIETQFDLREIKFYTEIAPALGKLARRLTNNEGDCLPIPSHYHAIHKKDSESILVMEDLRERGFAVQNLTEGLSLQQAKKAVECLAKIHATSYALQLEYNEELKSKFSYLLSPEKAEEAFHALFEKGLPLLLKYLEKKVDHSSMRSRLQEYCGNRSRDIFQRVLSPSNKVNTLVHCDFWCNNLLFKTEDNQIQCKIIDWQMILYGRPSIDLGMLIATSLCPQTRRDHEETILATYWNFLLMHLGKLGVKDKDFKYTLDDLKSDLRESLLFAVLVMIGSFDMALGIPRREDRVLSLVNDLINNGSL